MRLYTIPFLFVTAGFALGGCAADAETTSESPNIALADPNAPAVGADRTSDVGQTGKVSDLYANPADETRVRLVETWSGGVANPRIDIVPSGFGAVPAAKIGVTPPMFHEVNPLEIGARAEDGFTPYSHHPKP